MFKYNIWNVNQPVKLIESEEKLKLGTLQGLVGGFIEIIKAGQTTFIVNEEGRLNGSKENPAFPSFFGTVITTQDGI